MLADSNIVIYAAQPQHERLREFIRDNSPLVSVISYIEVLGFHGLKDPERGLLEEFFAVAAVLPLSDPVVQRAIRLRQQRRMSLGDSVVAATALVHRLTLVTHNAADFQWIGELPVLDPLHPRA